MEDSIKTRKYSLQHQHMNHYKMYCMTSYALYWNFDFPRYGYYIVNTTFGYCFKGNICSISKDVINTC